jgi:hypothetical protein
MTYRKYMRKLIKRKSSDVAFGAAAMTAALAVVLWIGGGIWITTGEPSAILFCLAAYLVVLVFWVLTPSAYHFIIWLSEKEDLK